jgi:hypothetical protein
LTLENPWKSRPCHIGWLWPEVQSSHGWFHREIRNDGQKRFVHLNSSRYIYFILFHSMSISISISIYISISFFFFKKIFIYIYIYYLDI